MNIPYDEMPRVIAELEEELDDYKTRIDKAVPILNELINLYDDNYTVCDKAKDAKNILEGEDK